MKIFLSFQQSAINHPIPAYNFWQYYIKNGIEEAGHEWVECPGVDWAFGLVPKSKAEHLQWKQDAWEKTVNYLKNSPADIFLSYLYPQQIDTEAINEIKKAGIPCVNFFCDHIRDFKKLPAEFGVFDLNWVPEYKAIDLYKKAGYPFIHLPMPVWIEPRLRVLQEENNKQITFIGSHDVQRQILFEKLVHQNPAMPIAIYGSGWDNDSKLPITQPADYTLNKKLLFQYNFIKQQGIIAYIRKIKQRNYVSTLSAALKSKIHGVPDFEQYNTLTAQSMVTMGVNRYPSYQFPLDAPDSYSRLRDIEAPMLGACYLTEYTPGIENMYEIGTEIETYKGAEDIIEKIKELEKDSQKRKMLKINGQQRALQQHSIPQSLIQILQRLG